MAIINKLPGVEVSIIINGQPAREYEDTSETFDGEHADKTVLRYIESISDTCFSIKIELLDGCTNGHVLSFCIILDGREIKRHHCFPLTTNAGDNLKVEGDENGMLWNDKKLLVPFKFPEVEILEETDSARIKEDTIAAINLGEIAIKASARRKPRETPWRSLLSRGAFGESIARPLTQFTKLVDRLEWFDDPYAIYKFRYRSKAALKAAFILDEFEDMSPEELRRRARELARNERSLAQERFFALGPRLECPFKDHRLITPQNIKPEQEIKVERGIKRERDHHDEGEPIDLTGDAPVAKRQMVPIDLTDD